MKDELESVKSQLKSLPSKTRHEIMVPFGVSNPSAPPLMLMEGSIVHTNEIMVLLGDNWFLERSASESIDIINRRQRKIESLVEKFNAEKEQHENWLNMIHSLYGGEEELCEINEKVDEEEEKRWREVHRLKVREHKMKEAAERAKIRESHEDMMRRLEQLEMEENGKQVPVKSSLKTGTQVSKSVSFKERGIEELKQVEEITKRPEKEEKESIIFSGKVVERGRGGEKREGEEEVRGKEREESAPLHDPPHKDQPLPPHPKKVSQFKLSRQSR